MNAPTRLAAFAAAVALLSGGAAVAGGAIDPKGASDAAAPHEPAHAGGSAEGAAGASHGDAKRAEQAKPVDQIRGLVVADKGLRLVTETPELPRGESARLSFRIVDEADRPVRDFDVEHERRMHLILARRDLTGFQHLHPRQADDGSWTTDVTVADPGSYRLFADFSRGDDPYTLASDVRVDGDADLRALPAPAATAVSDGGYDVRLDSGAARPGQEADLRFTVTRDGAPVRTEPFLGAGGHLVALREGDLAFLHVHPTEHDDSVGFAATFPTEGRYRLFLQFKHEGDVQTVAFTQEVK